MKKLLPALKRNSARIATVTGLALVAGCSAFTGSNEHREASSVMDYLYPKNSLSHVDNPGVPVLSLPLRVGVAFVPEHRNRSSGMFIPSDSDRFTEKQKMALMQQVSDKFKKYSFVQSIQLIPSTYLTPQGGFDNLDQLRQMFGGDVIALLSYDQVQFTDEGFFSFAYVTVVGAWVVEGERNDTKTMMDTVVYDIASRKLLFRAPGISQVKASATPVNLSEELRDNSEQGYQRAATNMTANLQVELAQFKDRVKSSPEEYKVVAKPGYSGAGAIDGLDLVLLATMGAGFLAQRKIKAK